MSRLSAFLKRERLYILLLIFVATMTYIIISAPQEKAVRAQGRPLVSASDAYAEKSQEEREAVEKILSENGYLSVMFSLATLLVIALFLLGVVIDALLLAFRISGRSADMATYRPGKVGWNLWDVAKVAILYLFFGYILLLMEAFLAYVFPVFRNNNFRMIFNTSIMDILAIVLIIHFTAAQYREGLKDLGLSLRNFSRNVFYGVVAYIALIPILIGIIALVALVINLTKYIPQKQPVVELFLKEESAPILLYTSLFAAIAGPLIEEIFFRGFLYNAVKKHAGVFCATMVTAALFAALHAHAVGFLPILALGILLAYLYERTGTLVSSITVHMIHNLGMVVLVFLVKQLGVYR